MELYTNDDNRELLQALNDVLPHIEQALKNDKPLFDGERYLTSEELCSILKLSRRTLQDYRNNGILPFIQLPGKVLFRESDIKKILEERFRPAYDKLSLYCNTRKNETNWSLLTQNFLENAIFALSIINLKEALWKNGKI